MTLVTTREVITEFLSYMAGLGAYFQRQALEVARRVLADRDLYRVMPQRDITFQQALDLYEQRPDKGYSLVDCISMVAMRSEGIPEIVTHDHHFEQEGFRILIKRPVESE